VANKSSNGLASSLDIFLTNFWTYANHGHALGELIRTKDFLEVMGNKSRIISLSSNIYPNLRLGIKMHRLKLDHNIVFKRIVDNLLIRDLEFAISKSISINSNEIGKIVFTSARTNHASRIDIGKLLKNNPEIELRIRLLDEPRDSHALEKLKELNKCGVLFAMESLKSIEEFRKFIPTLIHVPAAQTLFTKSELENRGSRNRVGVFWPVGRSYDENQIKRILRLTAPYNPVVKFPSGLDRSLLDERFPNIDIVADGLDEEQFSNLLSTIRIAILPHQGYIKQSSAYASYFASRNVPVITSKSNSFFQELSSYSEFIDLESNIQDLKGVISSALSTEMNYETTKYSIYSNKQWQKFLLEDWSQSYD
jgi:hypothetical protein